MADDKKMPEREEHFQSLRRTPVHAAERRDLTPEQQALKEKTMRVLLRAAEIQRSGDKKSMQESIRLAAEEQNESK